MSWGGMIGSIIGARKAYESSKSDRSLQRQAAQNSIQWRVADAKKAGVHPLYALGAPTMSVAPVGDGGAGALLSDAGQNLDRAIAANQTRRERRATQEQILQQKLNNQQQLRMNNLNMEHQELQNDYLRARIAQLNSPDQVGPPSPVSVGNMARDPAFAPQPVQSQMESSYMLGREAGHVADVRYARTPRGGLVIMRPHDLTESLEDDWVGGIQWDLRNRLLPNFNNRAITPSTREYPLPRGQVWRWSYSDQAFFPYDVRRREFIIDGRRRSWDPGTWFNERR